MHKIRYFGQSSYVYVSFKMEVFGKCILKLSNFEEFLISTAFFNTRITVCGMVEILKLGKNEVIDLIELKSKVKCINVIYW